MGNEKAIAKGGMGKANERWGTRADVKAATKRGRRRQGKERIKEGRD